MKIFFVTPEVAPFVSVGGLGEVAGSLPKYLKAMGHDVRVICPCYGSIGKREGWKSYDVPLEIWVGHEKRLCRVWETKLPQTDVPVYFIEYNFYYGRPEVYDSPWGPFQDNDHRFVFFSRTAIDFCNYLNWIPDVFHCHDWTTALLPVYLNTRDRETPVANAASVLTIHNVQFQGNFYSGLVEWAHLKRADVFHADNLESMGGVNLLKGGIYNATKISAVSPTYAKEIQTREGGFGLSDVLRFRSKDMVGILNGIDTQLWNPATDKYLPANYSAADPTGKAACKEKLQREFGLHTDAAAPVFSMGGRLVYQKGVDLLVSLLPRLMAQTNLQIAVHGQGEEALEKALLQLAKKFPGRVGVSVGFDPSRVHLLAAGSDALLMPSRFEPCGLSQIFAMRYGTLPIARATGGLKDTITPLSETTGEGTGFLFDEISVDAFEKALHHACKVFAESPAVWKKIQAQAMQKDFGWETSAKQYEALYEDAIRARTKKSS